MSRKLRDYGVGGKEGWWITATALSQDPGEDEAKAGLDVEERGLRTYSRAYCSTKAC
jgi:hypothetical protein